MNINTKKEIKNKLRIQKYLSEQGHFSRRQAEELIKKEKVFINKKIAQLGDMIDPSKDTLKVANKNILFIVSDDDKKLYRLALP